MNSLHKIFLLFVASILMGAVGTVRHSNLESFNADSSDETASISVTWTVSDPGLVSEFILVRKRGNNSEQRINSARFSNNGNTYLYEDSNLYKGQTDEVASTESVTYILRAVHKEDSSSHVYGETVVEYTTNAVRRTWGSIKAMFQ